MKGSWPGYASGFWICTAISVAVVLGARCTHTPPQSAPPQLAGLDATFASHAALTLAHILPALTFVVLALPIFGGSPVWLAETTSVSSRAVVGVTAYAMSNYSIGGWVERSAVLLFNSLFLFSLFRAWCLRREPAPNLRWLTRAIAILLGIATTRPVMGIFFATSPLTHLAAEAVLWPRVLDRFHDHTGVVELWLHSKGGRSQIERMAIRAAS